MPAAISAKEAGATVALIQKEATAISQGNTATGILLDGSDPAGVSAVVTAFKKTVERYNALAAEGKDEDFGKASKWLTTIDTRRSMTSTARCVCRPWFPACMSVSTWKC